MSRFVPERETWIGVEAQRGAKRPLDWKRVRKIDRKQQQGLKI